MFRQNAFRLGIALLAPMAAMPWGTEGHRAVALIAENLLTKNTEESIRMLMAHDVRLADLATCADEVRQKERKPSFQLSPACSAVFPNPPTGTSSWHFINIDVSTNPLSDAQILDFCGSDCVTKQIVKFTNVLANGATTRAGRQQALAFLVHFVGDLHQPLHAAVRNNDEGGNKVLVDIFDIHNEKLHSAWDTVIPTHIAVDETTFASLLTSEIQQAQSEPQVPIAQLQQAVLQWARQSLQSAKDTAYHGVKLPPSVTTLNEDYDSAAEKVVRMQIARGGVRLANLLNQTMAK